MPVGTVNVPKEPQVPEFPGEAGAVDVSGSVTAVIENPAEMARGD